MAPLRLSRRPLLAGALASALSASCQRKARCGHCGMALDPASRWYTELAFADGSLRGFDTPRCAFSAWRGPSREARELYARGHYGNARLPSESLVFAAGSDHHARSMVRASEVSPALLNELSLRR